LQRITLTPSQIHEHQIDLTSAQHHYLTRVIRLKTGGQFQAIDGTGKLYLAAIMAVSSPDIAARTAKIIQTIAAVDLDGADAIENGEITPSIVLICALPKGNNFDDLVRACTELGVTTIFPALSDRTLLKPSPHKLPRWCKIAQEAAEQSERTTIPLIAEPQALQLIFSQLPARSDRYLCAARGEHPHLLTCLQSRQLTDRLPIIIAIGPEGGWTDAEIDLAIQHNFQLVSLGRHILRTITAPIVALSIVAATIDRSDCNPHEY
jgi:16S rRNA (uracil1498-N3)-methyltransferase